MSKEFDHADLSDFLRIGDLFAKPSLDQLARIGAQQEDSFGVVDIGGSTGTGEWVRKPTLYQLEPAPRGKDWRAFPVHPSREGFIYASEDLKQEQLEYLDANHNGRFLVVSWIARSTDDRLFVSTRTYADPNQSMLAIRHQLQTRYGDSNWVPVGMYNLHYIPVTDRDGREVMSIAEGTALVCHHSEEKSLVTERLIDQNLDRRPSWQAGFPGSHSQKGFVRLYSALGQDITDATRSYSGESLEIN